MSEHVTFKDKNNRFELSTKIEFLEKCPDPHNHNIDDLHAKFYLFKFLHHPSAPAIRRFNYKPGTLEAEKLGYQIDGCLCEYWVNGENVAQENKELADKIHRNYLFANKLEDIIK